jgi:general secretion pathway protein D
MKFISRFLTLALVFFVVSGHAKNSFEFGNTKREQVNITFKNLKIDDFIKMSSKILQKNILMTQSIPGTVEFISETPLYKDELFDLMLSVLDSKGFTLVKDGNILKVVRSSQAIRENLDVAKKSNFMYTEIISVKNVPVVNLANRIKLFLSVAGKLITINESNSIIISDMPSKIEHIKEVIKHLDQQPDSQRSVEFITLKNAKASKVAGDLGKIAKALVDQKIKTNAVEVHSDDASNSVIIIANRDIIRRLTPYVNKLDEEDLSYSMEFAVIPLRNSDVKNIEKSLNNIISKKKYVKEDLKPMISSDEEMNAIIISATKDDIHNIKDIIDILDVEKPQVYVHAKIVEISENDARNLGVKYGVGGGTSNSGGLFTFAASLGGSAISLPTELATLIDTPSLKDGLALGASINFLETNGAATVLSEPSLLCVNNKESFIYVGKTQSILSSTSQGNSVTDLARNTYTRQDIGLTLKVKPRISSDTIVTLETNAKLEDIVNDSTPGLPTTTKREVQTVAIVHSGESIILGGLIKNKVSDSQSKIPGLGDIPLLGYAFKDTEKQIDQVNLVIILTPYIVKTSDDLAKLRKTLKSLDTLQKSFNAKLLKSLRDQTGEEEQIVDEVSKKVSDETMKYDNSDMRRSHRKRSGVSSILM